MVVNERSLIRGSGSELRYKKVTFACLIGWLILLALQNKDSVTRLLKSNDFSRFMIISIQIVPLSVLCGMMRGTRIIYFK